MAEVKRPRRQDNVSPPPSKRRKQELNGNDKIVLPAKSAAPPPAHWLRIYSWNVNGITSFIQSNITSFLTRSKTTAEQGDDVYTSTTSLRHFLRRQHWPQVVQLQEVKINPSDERTKKAVEKAVNLRSSTGDDGPKYIVKFCFPADKFNARGFGRKVYGVATILREDFFQNDVLEVRTVDWDLEGRVLVVETKSKLSIWNIYAVNGTTNPYRDPKTGEVAGTRHDRKLAFHKLMLEECKRLEAVGYRVVLGGDMNVARSPIDGFPSLRTFSEQHIKNRHDFNTKFFTSPEGLCAIDSFRHLHPSERKYTWVSRTKDWLTSCDRVDLIIVSRSLVEQSPHSLVEADILMTPADRGPSDHLPLYVSLDLSHG